MREMKCSVAIEIDDGGWIAMFLDKFDQVGSFEPDGGGVVTGVDADNAGAFFCGVGVKKILV